MHIPQLNGQDQQLTLTVGENYHYTLEGEEFTVNGMVYQRLEKDGVALTIADIKAKTRGNTVCPEPAYRTGSD